MGGDTTFFGSGAETTNLYLQCLKKQNNSHDSENVTFKRKIKLEMV